MPSRWKLSTPLVAGLILTLGLIFALWQRDQAHDHEAVRFHLRLTPDSPLQDGQPVSMQGVDVGSVQGIHDKTAELIMVREAAIRLPIDSRLSVVPRGLLGDQRVDIEPGDGPTAPAGHTFTETPLPPEDKELNRLLKKALTKGLKDFVGEE